MVMKKKGLYDNIHARRKSGKPMRKKGDEGAPSDADFRAAAKTAKPRYAQGGMARENNMQQERMMDAPMRQGAQQDMRQTSPKEKLIKKMLMEEIMRRKQGGMGQPSPARQGAMQQRAQQDEMDRKMRESAARPPAQRGYARGGAATLTPAQKRALMMALRNRRGR